MSSDRYDSSLHIGENVVDREKARRLVWLAQQTDEREERAWERRCTAELADPTPAPEPKTSAWKSRRLDGITGEHAAITDRGQLYRVGDVETAQFASPMQTRSLQFQARVESTLQEICRDETGQFETETETAKRIERDARLREQGSIICDALERQGVIGYRPDAWQLISFGVHSHEITEIPAFRRICLNPYVAHRLRLPMLNWLQYFAQDKTEHELRFWTFTTGRRVPIHRLQARMTWLHRRISELNAQQFMLDAGVRIIFRATEFGTLESEARKSETADAEESGGKLEGGKGGCWYHPHAHCVVWRKRRLSKWQWRGLLEDVWRFWHHHWDEGGRIRDMRECVKYVTKPGDIVWLAENNPAELKKLQEVVFLKRLVTPLDELMLQRRAAKLAGLRPVLRWKNDVLRWVLERDANANPMPRGSQDSGLIASDGVKPDFRAAFDDCSVPTPTHMTNTAAERHFRRDKNGVKKFDGQTCRVVARCSPSYNSRGVKEQRVILMGNFLDKRSVLSHPLVRRIVSATRAAYEEGVRARAATLAGLETLRVHTGTPTVPTFEPPRECWEPDEAHEPDIWLRSEPISANN